MIGDVTFNDNTLDELWNLYKQKGQGQEGHSRKRRVRRPEEGTKR